MKNHTAFLRELYETISMRCRPEDVAAMVLPVLRGEISLPQRLVIADAARHGKTGFY